MSPFSTPRARWTAITTRDPSASSAFIYCVISTKIYCRPTCPARLARRANVIFHDNVAEAEAAGYRACMRCRPGDVDESSGDPQRIAVEKACTLIRDELKNGTLRAKWSVKSLAKEVGLTESHFCRIFKKVMGVTVGEHRAQIWDERMRGCEWMVSTKATAEAEDQTIVSPIKFSILGVGNQDFFDEELARDWQDFSGVSNMDGTIDMFPGFMGSDLIGFDLSPETLSDVSTPATTDDGLQFLNFDEIDGSIGFQV